MLTGGQETELALWKWWVRNSTADAGTKDYADVKEWAVDVLTNGFPDRVFNIDHSVGRRIEHKAKCNSLFCCVTWSNRFTVTAQRGMWPADWFTGNYPLPASLQWKEFCREGVAL